MNHPAYQLDWNLIRTFTAVIDSGSLAAAARTLDLTYPTVARHIQLLEEALTMPLFDRTSSGLAPNPAGLALANTAQEMRTQASAFEAGCDALRTNPSGSVRITSSEALGQRITDLLLPLRDWAHENAATIEVVPTNTMMNLLEHDADIAFRHARPSQTDLIARKCAELPLSLWSSHKQAKTINNASEPELEELMYIDGIDADHLDQGARELGFTLPSERFVFRSDCMWSRIHAARTGWGITTLPDYIGTQFPDLVPVLTHLPIKPLDVWAVARQEMRANPLHRRVFEELSASIGDPANRCQVDRISAG